MSSDDAAVITTQPKTKRQEIDNFVRDLDPTQVAGKGVGEAFGSGRWCVHRAHSTERSFRCTNSLAE